MFHPSSMFSTLGRTCAALAVALCAGQPTKAIASPVTYEIAFANASGGPVPTAGSFIYDESTQDISGLSVTWVGRTFTDFIYNDGPCGAGDAGLFRLLTQTCSGSPVYEYSAFGSDGNAFFSFNAVGATASSQASARVRTSPDIPNVAQGSWSVVPTPGTFALAMLGLLGLGLSRRRAEAAKLPAG